MPARDRPSRPGCSRPRHRAARTGVGGLFALFGASDFSEDRPCPASVVAWRAAHDGLRQAAVTAPTNRLRWSPSGWLHRDGGRVEPCSDGQCAGSTSRHVRDAIRPGRRQGVGHVVVTRSSAGRLGVSHLRGDGGPPANGFPLASVTSMGSSPAAGPRWSRPNPTPPAASLPRRGRCHFGRAITRADRVARSEWKRGRPKRRTHRGTR